MIQQRIRTWFMDVYAGGIYVWLGESFMRSEFFALWKIFRVEEGSTFPLNCYHCEGIFFEKNLEP